MRLLQLPEVQPHIPKPETKVKSFSVFLRAIYDFSVAFHYLHFLFIAMNYAEVKKLRFLTVRDIIRNITL